ncbi:MAG: helix-turn-helix domain-containing protein [Candidatus Sedimenticola sp. (ex Thyasira tokunagai)]
MDKKKTMPGADDTGTYKVFEAETISADFTTNLATNSTANQCLRILRYLQKNCCLTTITAREKMGIMAPAPRIQELREQGYIIITNRLTLTDALGVHHPRSAEYVLLSLQQEG